MRGSCDLVDIIGILGTKLKRASVKENALVLPLDQGPM
jgi:hypothetical protein